MKATNLIILTLMASTLIACSKKRGQTIHTETVKTEIKTEIKTEKEIETITIMKEKTETIFQTIVEQKILSSGDIEVDTLKLTPMGIAKAAATATFSCASNIDEAITISNGLILLNNSSALIKRDIAKNQTGTLKAYATFDCKNDIAEQVEHIDLELIIQKTINAGDGMMEYVVLAGERPNIDHSELSYISCSESKEAALQVLTHGVNLIKGSRLLVRRDNKNADQAEFSLISCE